MKRREAIAEIAVDSTRGWVLPRFGNHPLTYQAWVRFKDCSIPKGTWTLIVSLDEPPDLTNANIDAKVSFLASEAPQGALRVDSQFELYMGQVYYTSGRIKRIVKGGSSA